jgi:hypothetical protein
MAINIISNDYERYIAINENKSFRQKNPRMYKAYIFDDHLLHIMLHEAAIIDEWYSSRPRRSYIRKLQNHIELHIDLMHKIDYFREV